MTQTHHKASHLLRGGRGYLFVLLRVDGGRAVRAVDLEYTRIIVGAVRVAQHCIYIVHFS